MSQPADVSNFFFYLGKLWLSSFQKTIEPENPMVGSKVMALGSVLMHSTWFLRYPNCFNFDFDPWVVVGKVI